MGCWGWWVYGAFMGPEGWGVGNCSYLIGWLSLTGAGPSLDGGAFDSPAAPYVKREEFS